MIVGDRTKLTNVLAAMCKASAAGIRYLKSANGAFVTSDLNYLYNVGITLVAAHSKLYSLTENSSFLVDAATHCGLVTRNELLGNIHDIVKKLILPRKTCYFLEHLIFKMLYLGIKFSNSIMLLL